MANKIDLGGRSAVVTGGAQGIGRAIAERFLDSGAAVAIWDRDRALAEQIAGELGNRGKVESVVCDVTKLAEIERAREATVKALGRIDILVNNAGIAGPNVKTWEYDPAAWSEVMRVNLDSQFYCCRAIVPLMIAQNYGRIVNIASIAGKEGNPNAPAYSASKAGVIALTKSLGKELAGYDIAVNCVTPAAARTALFDQMTQEQIDYMLSKIPRGRFVQGRRDRRAGRLPCLGGMLVLHRRRVRHFRWAGDLLTDPANEQRRLRLTGIGLMCAAVLCFACLDAMAKYLGTHMATLQVVGVRYAAAFFIALMVSNPITRPSLHTDRPACAANASRGSAARLNRVQFHGVPLSPTRRGAGDPVFDAVPGGDPRRSDPGRMGGLAALDRDPGRLRRRAGGGAARPRRDALGGAALARQRGMLRGLQHRDPNALDHRFERDHAVLRQPVRRGGRCCRFCRSSGRRRRTGWTTC